MALQNTSEGLFNVTKRTSHNPFQCYYQADIVPFVILATVMFVSITGNVLVILIFCRKKALRQSVHYFITSMAVSDLLKPFSFMLPMSSALLHKDNRWLLTGTLGSAVCKITFYFWQVSRFVALFSMIATAADRYRAIVFPFRPALIRRKRIPIVVTATWIISFALPAHFLHGIKLVSCDSKLYCVFQWEPLAKSADALKVSYLVFLCITITSSIALTVLYTKIIIHLYKQSKTAHLDSEAIKMRKKDNRQITIMLIVVVVAFYVTWSPVTVTNITWFFKPEERFQCDKLGTLIYLLYPVLNPVIYFIFNKNYRRGFKDLLCFCCISSSYSHTSVAPRLPDVQSAPSPKIGHENKAINNDSAEEGERDEGDGDDGDNFYGDNDNDDNSNDNDEDCVDDDDGNSNNKHVDCYGNDDDDDDDDNDNGSSKDKGEDCYGGGGGGDNDDDGKSKEKDKDCYADGDDEYDGDDEDDDDDDEDDGNSKNKGDYPVNNHDQKDRNKNDNDDDNRNHYKIDLGEDCDNVDDNYNIHDCDHSVSGCICDGSVGEDKGHGEEDKNHNVNHKKNGHSVDNKDNKTIELP